MSRTTKWFWAIVVAQAAFLLGWAGYHEFVRHHSPVILLKGRPVDPQDLLRGDYMTMAYDISFAGAIEGKASPSSSLTRSDVWVLLEKRGTYHEIAKVSRERPQPGPGQVLVRGWEGYDFGGTNARTRINYGIERFFVPEGRGSPRFTLVEVEVSVSPAQRLYIKRVLLDGKAYPKEQLSLSP